MRAALSIILAVALGAAALGQGTIVPGNPDREMRYQAIRGDTGVTSQAITIQQPATTPSATVQLELASIWCSVACTATLSWNGTAATSTALSTTALNGAPPSTATAWRSSNVGSGTTGNVFNLAANTLYTLDLSKFYLGKGGGAGQNFTISIASASGNYQVMIQWVEK